MITKTLETARRKLGIRKEIFDTETNRILDIGVGDESDRKRGNVGVDLRRSESVDVLADGTELPFHDESFDAVVCYHVIEHLRPIELNQLLREIRRVLRSDARAYLLVDRDESEEALMQKDETHVARYDPRQLQLRLLQYFDVDVYQTHNVVGNVHNHPWSWWGKIDKGTKIYAEVEK